MAEIPEDVRAILNNLPSDPREFLTDEDKAQFVEWSERNRLRKERIAAETGLPMNEVG